ncbi:hypothetical protein [Microvirga aerophila]|uniref:KfrA N-terminal DNA-binding domain-containing protein n=1 Tax=Microvirga aerophila TaxID=670291 RepID=A0A512C3D5_9HYPH|nr:hypothetical protein [Microvirga aerophila]GEO18728.1 hypothetical protein MAE02_64240 [Microvirga aerophila]
MSETRFVTVTYREIAERFGIGIEGARIKAKRRAAKGLWRIIPGNHPQDIIRVEIPEDEFTSSQPAQRGATYNPNDGTPTTPPQQEEERRDANDIDALVELISQLTTQSAVMTDRLVDAEKGKAEAERDAAIARAALASAEARLTAMQEGYLSDLKELRDRMETESDRARSELAEWKARPWWRRLAG